MDIHQSAENDRVTVSFTYEELIDTAGLLWGAGSQEAAFRLLAVAANAAVRSTKSAAERAYVEATRISLVVEILDEISDDLPSAAMVERVRRVKKLLTDSKEEE